MLSAESRQDAREAERAGIRQARYQAMPKIPGWGQVSRYRALDHWRRVRWHALDRIVRRELRAWADRGLNGLLHDCISYGYNPTLPESLTVIADFLREKDIPVTVRPG